MKMAKRFLSVLLGLVMALGLVPGMSLTAYADNSLVGTIIKQGDTLTLNNEYIEYMPGQTAQVDGEKEFYLDSFHYNEEYNGWVFEFMPSGGFVVSGPKTPAPIGFKIDSGDGKTKATAYKLKLFYASYSVTITPGSNMTKTAESGAASQTGLSGAMTPVVYKANTNCQFPKTSDLYKTTNGIKVERTNDTTVTVSGTPTADATVIIPDAAQYIAVNNVSLNPGSASSKVGDTLQLTATVSPDGATDRKVKWSVGGENASAVALYSDQACTTPVGTDATETLTVYAKCNSVGSATVTAASNDDASKSATCNVTVSKGENPLTYPATQTVEKTFSTSNQTNELAAATNGQGDVSYAINSQKDTSNADVTYFSLDGTTLTLAANTPVGSYSVVVRATAAGNGNYNGGTKDSTVTVSVGTADNPVTYAESQTVTKTFSTAAQTATLEAAENGVGELSYGITSQKKGEDTVNYFTLDGTTLTLAANTPVGTYTVVVWARAAGNGNYFGGTRESTVTVTVNKADPTVTAPTAKTLTYNGSAQALVNAGSATGGTLYYAVTTENKAPTDENLYTTSIPSATDAGTYYVWYKVVGDANHNDSEPQKVASTIAKHAVALTGSGHVQKLGDVAAKASGKGISIGTTGEAKRLEQFTVSLPKDTNGGIEYRAHLQGKGWGDWVQGGRPCGTTNEARRMEAVQMRLTGALAKTHSVWYRVHSQTWGTLGWAKDGQAAGTSGQAKRAEAVEVQVLPQGQVPEGYEEKQASYVGAVSADVHLQKVGWTGASSALEFGTTGQARRLEAVRISAPATPVSAGISYEAHVQREGWMPAAADGALAGTTGQAKRLEAVRISLTGDAAKDGNYSVWYRVHSQTFGWLGWAHDGQEAGTTGLARRAEAIDVQVLPQGQVPRGYDASKGACVNG